MNQEQVLLFYPGHFTTEYLKEIFHFSPTKQREFIRKLRPIRSGWAKKFEDEFFPSLREFLGDPANWQRYNQIAEAIQNKKSRLTVLDAVSHHHARVHRDQMTDLGGAEEPKFLPAILSNCKTNAEYVSRFLELERPKNAAEVIWYAVGMRAFESDDFGNLVDYASALASGDEVLLELIDPLILYLRTKSKGAHQGDEQTLESKCATIAAELRDLLSQYESDVRNLELAGKIGKKGKKLFKIASALASEVKFDFGKLEADLTRFVELANGDWELDSAGELMRCLASSTTEEAKSGLQQIASDVASAVGRLQDVSDEISTIKAQLNSKTRPDRQLARQLADKSDALWNEIRQVQEVLSNFLVREGQSSRKEAGIEKEQEQEGSIASNAGDLQAKPEVKVPDAQEPLDSSETPVAVTPAGSEPSFEQACKKPEPEVGESPIEEQAGSYKELVSDPVSPDTDAQRVLRAEPTGKSVVDSSRLNLEGLVASGDFSLAYWLCEAKRLAGHEVPVEACFLGAVASASSDLVDGEAGSRIRDFLSQIAQSGRHGKDEQLLSATALVTAMLLAGGAARTENSVQSLANSNLKSSVDALNELLDFVIESIIRRGWIPKRQAPSGSKLEIPVAERLAELSEEARQFLLNVKQVRFSYQPAYSAYLEMFADGSDFNFLLTAVAEGTDSERKLNRVEKLLERIDPNFVVNNLENYTSFKGHLQGSARSQFTSKLSKGIDIAVRWYGLRRDQRQKSGGHEVHQYEEKLRSLLGKTIKALDSHQHKSAFTTAVARGASVSLNRTLGILSGDNTQVVTGIDNVLLEFGEIELDVEFGPIESELPKLIDMSVENRPPTGDLMSACIERHEYSRASCIASLRGEQEKWASEIEGARNSAIKKFRAECDQAEEDVEEINLLGMLAEGFSIRADGDAEASALREGRPAEAQTTNIAAGRAELLTKLADARQIVELVDKGEEADVRSAVEILSSVSQIVGEKKHQRQRYLEERVSDHIAQMRSGGGQHESDADYIDSELNSLLESGDNVALAELLDRVEAGLREGKSVERVAAQVEPEADQFLREYDQLDEWKNGKSLENAIGSGTNLGPLQLANRDKAHRERALAAIKAWSRLRSKKALVRTDEDNKSACKAILNFIGITDIGKLDFFESPGPGILRFTVQLDSNLASPIPAFGSDLAGTLNVVIFGTKQQPRQIIQAVQKVHKVKAGALVVHLDALSARQRLDIRDLCIREKLTCAVLDFPLLAYLCGARDPLLTFFDIVLPLTWSQPYLKVGERVPREMFVGRSDQVADLKDPTGSCIVFGGRQLGKSALLRHLAAEHHSPEDGLFIAYKDIDDLGNPPQDHQGMEEELWLRISQEISHRGFLSEKDQVAISGGKITRKNARTVVPNLIRTRLEEREDQRLILLLDEVDDLLDMDSTADFRVVKSFRALMSETGRRFKVVFTGLKSVQRFKNYENQPFTQLGSAIVIRPLPPKDAEDLVRRPLRALGFTFEAPSLMLRILSQSNYHPGLVQIFCYRLVENLNSSRERGSAIQEIAKHDVNMVERNPGFIEDIRNRFDWTLDLDERYKVLTYALVMSDSASLQLSVSQFKDVGRYWWPQVFENMDQQTMRGLLDEMEGLGVLLKIQERNLLTYRLRSPNLLRLLGAKKDIESEMEKIIERPSQTKRNPRNFHRLLDAEQTSFGPMTMEQESQIANFASVFRIFLIYGSQALGIHKVEDHIRQLLSSMGDSHGQPWQCLRLPTSVLSAGEEKLAGHLKDKMKTNKRDHLYAFCHLSELPKDVDLETLTKALMEGPGRACRSSSLGSVFLIADEESSWNLLIDERFQKFVKESGQLTEISLNRWSDGAIAQALDDLGLKTRATDNGTYIFAHSQGLHTIVHEVLRELRLSQNPVTRDVIAEATDLAIRKAADPQKGLGFDIRNSELMQLLAEVLDLGVKEGAERLEWDTTLDLLADMYPQLLEDGGRSFRKWIQAIGLAGPFYRDGQMSLVTYAKNLIH